MAKIISFHSFRRGTGTSSLAASTAALLAAEGKRVGVVDTALQSPSAHILFGLKEAPLGLTINDYLWKNCPIEQTVYDVTPHWSHGLAGRIYLAPASSEISKILRVLREGYEVEALNAGFARLIEAFDLDALVIDTSAGLNEETLISLAVSDALFTILRLDRQDYQGTAVVLGLAQKLEIPRQLLIVNNSPPMFAVQQVRREVEEAYGCKVNAVLPHSEEMLTLASGGIFALQFPDHPITLTLRRLAAEATA